jgi:hypothetical protein
MGQPFVVDDKDVGTNGKIQIVISQISQNLHNNTSVVEVDGLIGNEDTNTTAFNHTGVPWTIKHGSTTVDSGTFTFNLKPEDSMQFCTGNYTIAHAADGNQTVTFTVGYGVTSTAIFDDNQSITKSLDLTRIPQPAAKPSQPVFSNQRPTSVTVSWGASPDNGGSEITGYQLLRSEGPTMAPNPVSSTANNLVRNVTNLTPGTDYTFEVFAINGSAINGGTSAPSDKATYTSQGGAWIRHEGVWVQALPYIRRAGVWQLAIPYVREGAWKLTEL